MQQEYIDVLIRSCVFGFFACVSGLVGKFWYNARKKYDANITHLTSERDKGLEREQALRIELEICRYTYIECHTYLMTNTRIAHILRDALHNHDPNFVMEILDTSSMPPSLNTHIENLLKQQEPCSDSKE